MYSFSEDVFCNMILYMTRRVGEINILKPRKLFKLLNQVEREDRKEQKTQDLLRPST